VDATLILVRANRLDVLLDSIRFLLAGHAVGGENQVMSRTLRASAGGYCYHTIIMKKNLLKTLIWLFMIGEAVALAQVEQKKVAPELNSAWDTKAARNLAKLLESKDVKIRRDAIRAVYSLRWNAKFAIPALTKALKDPDMEVRGFAAACFRFFGPPVGDPGTAVPVLAELMIKDEAAAVRGASAVSLRHLTRVDKKITKQVVPAFVVGLKDKDEYVRVHSACALGILGEGGQKPFRILADFLQGDDEELRGEAIGALGEIGMPSLQILKESLKDKRFRVRLAALGGFSCLVEEVRHKKKEVSPEIISLVLGVLADPAKEVSVRAMTVLAEIGPPAKEAISKTAEMLKDPDWTVRRVAAMCLRDYGLEARVAIPALRAALKDEEIIVREEIEKTLRVLDK
jgi:HEAT repeat protein